ncbi:hypothetical protein BS78_01G375400 [Paspalum vaginatum]|nr:hypothetical protein BS78_01G375400 [Paspalum vaginatum]
MIGRKGRLTVICHNEYGITDLRRKVTIKPTYLFREVRLRLEARLLSRQYTSLIAEGMRGWEAYKEHQESFKRSLHAIRRALMRYKDRRIESGYFYICKHKSKQYNRVFVMSPLYYMPRKEALKRVRYLLQRRQAYAPPSRTADNVAVLGASTHGSILARFVTSFGNIGGRRLTIKVWLIYLFVTVILACIILFY